MKFETKAIRIQTERSQHREHGTPIFPTSSFVFNDAEQMRSLFAGEETGNIYSRFTNPSVREFELKIAALEEVDDAFATSTGMAAVFAVFMTFLKKGDHVLASKALFGSTYNLLNNRLSNWGIKFDFIDPQTPKEWEEKVQSNTKMLFIETPSNPGLEIIDLEKAGQFSKNHQLIFCVDNCFATPYLQQPTKYGTDIIVHSATKFMDGQGRVMGGAIAGSQDLVDEVRSFCRSTGPALSPFNAWVLSKSLETLAVRMDRHCENAISLAKFLESHPEVLKVNYPFLESHPSYQVAIKQMSQGGGLVTFEVKGGLKQGIEFLNAMEMLSLSANLGDTRTIATHPASTTHAKVSEEARLEVGVTNSLIRISVGLEHIEDIIGDIDNALNKSSQHFN
ncbi:MAG: aminotransferase class I/II-fold pyridoxal phosphate-dependent enzyme [Saprospiraceae bacterium]|nr:aminotransferase class I/II-fold pyridoxal phosphate-dependent enzyme [Saprospiraceae bacterium]MDG2419376.1 aminotransferase class I/II-fold pyridoxal phosphate-dependent enzyme [Saprospiraceae bacterium]